MPNDLHNSEPGSLFDWDEQNIRHIAEHEVAPHEAEEALLGETLDLSYDPDVEGEERWAVIGETSQGRILFTVFTFRGSRMRVVTTFNAEKQDMLLYMKMKWG